MRERDQVKRMRTHQVAWEAELEDWWEKEFGLPRYPIGRCPEFGTLRWRGRHFRYLVVLNERRVLFVEVALLG